MLKLLLLPPKLLLTLLQPVQKLPLRTLKLSLKQQMIRNASKRSSSKTKRNLKREPQLRQLEHLPRQELRLLLPLRSLLLMLKRLPPLPEPKLTELTRPVFASLTFQPQCTAHQHIQDTQQHTQHTQHTPLMVIAADLTHSYYIQGAEIEPSA